MSSKPILSEDGREVTVDGIIVLRVTKSGRGWRWLSSIWMRSSRRVDFKTPEVAMTAGRKALRV